MVVLRRQIIKGMIDHFGEIIHRSIIVDYAILMRVNQLSLYCEFKRGLSGGEVATFWLKAYIPCFIKVRNIATLIGQIAAFFLRI